MFSRDIPGGLRFLQAGALTAITCSVLLPIEGFGFSICIFYNISGLPCPGCGFTRALISIGHGDLLHSLRAHPFGLFGYAAVVLLALSAFFHAPARWLVVQQPKFQRAAIASAVIFLLFGIVRLAAIVLSFEGLGRFTVFAK